MAAEIDPVILELRAELGKYRADLKSSTSLVQNQFGRQERSVQRLEAQMRKSSGAIGNSLRGLATTLGTYFTGRELAGLIDGFTRLQNNLRVAGLEGEDLARVQTQLLDLSSRYGTSVEGLSGVFLKASLAQKELGASTSQIIDLNEIVAASLKITGTSAQEAQGALLQLGQALGSGVVRAEEFNSILEGALPLAQAAARGIDGYGGSVAKLRAAVADGKITSQQFFEGVLKGGVQTINDAEKATLTLSGAFEALSSRLTVYVGESAKANGVTQALAGGMVLLADNLDTVLTALAIIGSALGIGFVANAVRARLAAIATAGAMTTMGAAASRVSAILGGPVGIAITGVTVAIGALAYASRDTAASLEELEGNLATAEGRLDDARKQAKAAGLNIESLKKSSDAAADSFSGFTNAVWAGVDAMVSAAKAAKDLTLAKIALSSAEARSTIAELAPKARYEAFSIRSLKASGFDTKAEVAAANETSARLNVAAATLRANAETKNIVEALGDKFKEPTSASGGSAPASTGGKPKNASGAKKAPKDRTDVIAARSAQELASLEIEQLRAQSQLATNAEDRAEFERQILAKERDARNADLDAALNAGDITKAQADAQREILDKLYGRRDAEGKNGEIVVEGQKSLYGEQQAREDRMLLFDESRDLAETQYRAEQDALRNQYDLATTDDDRRRIALQILDAEDAYLRSKLETVKDNNYLSDAVRKQAQIELDALNSSAPDRRRLVEKANQGALGRYIDGITDTKARVEDAMVRQLQEVNDGITDALTEQLGIKNRFVKDLFSIFLDQAIFQPLAEALRNRGSGGGGGFFGSIISGIGAIFGGGGLPGSAGGMDLRGFRAGGGPVAAGSLYRINENATPGNPEYFQPANSGNIIPLGRVNQMAAQAGGQAGIATVRLELAGDIDARIARVSGPVAVEVVRATAPTIIEGAVGETFRRSGRPKM